MIAYFATAKLVTVHKNGVNKHIEQI